MADPKFFDKQRALSLKEIAEIAGAALHSEADAGYMIEDVAALDEAGALDFSFLDNVKYKEQFKNTQAGACVIHPDQKDLAPDGLKLLLSPNPYKSYALVAQAFYPEHKPAGSISEHACIHPDAIIGEGCVIEAGAIIKEGVVLGEGCWIQENTVLGVSAQLGDFVRVGGNSTLSHCHIGSYSKIYPGVRIGQDGFGFAMDLKGHVKVPQLGRVIIEEHVEIGANTTIDRGAGPDTIIGQGTWIDNLVQIGHNVKMGRGCVMVAQSGISGSTVVGDFVVIGGQVGIAGHLTIGSGARIAAKSGIMRDVGAGEEQMGYPAIPLKQYMKQVALLKRLIKKDKGVN